LCRFIEKRVVEVGRLVAPAAAARQADDAKPPRRPASGSLAGRGRHDLSGPHVDDADEDGHGHGRRSPAVSTDHGDQHAEPAKRAASSFGRESSDLSKDQILDVGSARVRSECLQAGTPGLQPAAIEYAVSTRRHQLVDHELRRDDAELRGRQCPPARQRLERKHGDRRWPWIVLGPGRGADKQHQQCENDGLQAHGAYLLPSVIREGAVRSPDGRAEKP